MNDARAGARSSRRNRWIVASLLVAAGVQWPLSAQVLPQSSGNSWFYSPQHFDPFAKAADDKREAEIAPRREHHHHHHDGVDSEPC